MDVPLYWVRHNRTTLHASTGDRHDEALLFRAIKRNQWLAKNTITAKLSFLNGLAKLCSTRAGLLSVKPELVNSAIVSFHLLNGGVKSGLKTVKSLRKKKACRSEREAASTRRGGAHHATTPTS